MGKFWTCFNIIGSKFGKIIQSSKLLFHLIRQNSFAALLICSSCFGCPRSSPLYPSTLIFLLVSLIRYSFSLSCVPLINHLPKILYPTSIFVLLMYSIIFCSSLSNHEQHWFKEDNIQNSIWGNGNTHFRYHLNNNRIPNEEEYCSSGVCSCAEISTLF